MKTKVPSSVPERMLVDLTIPDDTFSPIKVTDDEDDESVKQIQTAPTSTPSASNVLSKLKLKIPLSSRASFEKQAKLYKKSSRDASVGEKKGLKLIIDKKRVINPDVVTEQTSEVQKEQQLNDEACALDLSFKSSKTAKEDDKSSLMAKKNEKSTNMISFNIGDDNEDELEVSGFV